MYKVTDKDGHSIYLLGTMHVISRETLPIAHLDEVLGQVDRVVFEMSEADMQKLTSGNVSDAEASQAGLTIMVPGNETRKYAKDREHGKMGIEERRSNHATQCVHTGVQSQDRHRGA